MIALVLQARLDSCRLPGKALLPLAGEALVYRVMRRLALIPADAYALACPEDSVEAFKPLADRAGFSLIAGPKDDVLSRYLLAAHQLGAQGLIRATGDNPFVLVAAAAKIAAEGITLAADYAAYAGLAYGAGIEYIAVSALEKAAQNTQLKDDREHVCPYLLKNPADFQLHRPLAPAVWRSPQYRITVDYREDYHRAQELFDLIGSELADDAKLLSALAQLATS